MLEAKLPTNPEWDDFVKNHPRANVLQLSQWGQQKGAFGWDDTRIALFEDANIVAGAQILFRALPFGLGTLAYIPFGPYITKDNQWEQLWKAIRKISLARKAKFLKIEPGFYLHEPQPDFETWGFRDSPQRVQPPRTIMIDISSDEDTILSRMNQGTRRKIRKGLKDEIEYYEGTQDDVAAFGQMMQTTGTRNEFGVHEPAYFELAYQLFVPDHGALILAKYEGKPLAGIFVFSCGNTAIYMYGASSSENRNLMASYGVQWKAIQWAKERGCKLYDMWGVPDEDPEVLEAEFQDRNDGLWGVYGFKRGWGGEIVRSAGALDLAYNPMIYQAYRVAINLRK